MNNLPMANAIPAGTDVDKIKRIVVTKQLGGLANNTKWNELISFIRDKEKWKPSYRTKSITGYVSDWDTEWYYHLPFPFISVEWFDISLSSNTNESTDWIIHLVEKIGFEFEVKEDILRIWGYAPKSYDYFQNKNA